MIRSTCFFLLLAGGLNLTAAPRATFTLLGDLPGGKIGGTAHDVSDDGRVVAGASWGGNGLEAFRWVRGEGMMGLGPDDANGLFLRVTSASSVSGDGTIIVGSGRLAGAGGYDEAYRWTLEDGIEKIGLMPGGGTLNSASAMTSDGRVIVGRAAVIGGYEPYRWDAAGGAMFLGNLKGIDKVGGASAVSDDGTVIVGSSYSPQGYEAFRWTAETGMVGLGAFPNSFRESGASDVSSDGKVIVGSSMVEADDGSGDSYNKAFRWTEDDGMVRIADYFKSGAAAVSGDGTIVVGNSREGGFIWIEGMGGRLLIDYLADNYDLGIDLDGWKLSANGISEDGTKIVGDAKDPDGVRQPMLIDLAPADLPEISMAPSSVEVNTASPAVLSIEATGEGLEYQWRIDGVDVLGATESTYTIPSVQRYHAGAYSVVVSNGGGSVSSAAAQVTVEPPPSSDARLTNLSTRAVSLTGNNVLIPGFVIEGTGTKSLLIRAVGASLRLDPFNIATALEDPQMTLKRWTGAAFEDVDTNDNWESNTNSTDITQAIIDLGAFALTDGRDAALLADLDAGRYSVIAGGVGDLTGVAIVELYDADSAGSGTVLANISNRGFVGNGASIMIPGISVSSEGPKTFLIRAVGPTLGADPFNLPGVLQDPKLTVYEGPDAILANDNWGDNPDADYTKQIAGQLGAFALVDGSRDAAFVVTLPPGSYTIQAAGANGGEGTALVEVYVVE